MLVEFESPIKPLQELLKYRNSKITDNLVRYYFKFSKEEVEDIFVEMLKWLWLCANAYQERRKGIPNVPKRLNIQSGMLVLDVIWHVFVLHTKDYQGFCNEYFGEFIHHSPAHGEYIPPTEEETTIQLSYIFDKLQGEETLTKWFTEYAELYSQEKIRERQIPFEVFFER